SRASGNRRAARHVDGRCARARRERPRPRVAHRGGCRAGRTAALVVLPRGATRRVCALRSAHRCSVRRRARRAGDPGALDRGLDGRGGRDGGVLGRGDGACVGRDAARALGARRAPRGRGGGRRRLPRGAGDRRLVVLARRDDLLGRRAAVAGHHAGGAGGPPAVRHRHPGVFGRGAPAVLGLSGHRAPLGLRAGLPLALPPHAALPARLRAAPDRHGARVDRQRAAHRRARRRRDVGLPGGGDGRIPPQRRGAPLLRHRARHGRRVALLAIVATASLTTAFAAGPFDLFYPLRVAAAGAALWAFRRAYGELRWTWSWPAVAAGALGFGLWVLLVPRPVDPEAVTASWQAALGGLPPAAAALWLGLRIAGAVITAPLAEELAFRSYLTRRLMAADFARVPAGAFSWTSFLVSSALFGAMHGAWLAGTVVGMLYALVWYR